MAAPNAPTQTRPSLPRLCCAPPREHIWSIDTPSTPQESVGVEGCALPRSLEEEFRIRTVQQLDHLSQQVDSLLRGQSAIEKMSSIIVTLGELPAEIAKLRLDVSDALQQNHQNPNAADLAAIQHPISNQQIDSVQEDWKEKPQPPEDSRFIPTQDNEPSHEAGKMATIGRGSSMLSVQHVVSKRRSGLFGDRKTVKELVEGAQYDVRDFYHRTGHMQRIARSDTFSRVMVPIIVANTIYIGIEVDRNRPNSPDSVRAVFLTFDLVFCLVFVIEWIIRFSAFQRKYNCLKDVSFKFDSVLVLLMVTEACLIPLILGSGYGSISSATNAMGLVKLLRLLRLARIGRVLRALPELVAMIKGVNVASRSVGSAFLMLGMIIYVFAIALFILLSDVEDSLIKDRFNKLISTMMTIALAGTLLDEPGELIRRLESLGETTAIALFMIFVLISALTVMNMLVGVLCAVVVAVAESEKNGAAFQLIKNQILVLLQELDQDNSGLISRDEMVQVLDNECALETLHSLKVEETVLLAHLDMFFDRSTDLPFWHIMELILMLRNDTQPSMMHLTLNSEYMLWKVGKLIEKALDVDMQTGTDPVHMKHVAKFMLK